MLFNRKKSDRPVLAEVIVLLLHPGKKSGFEARLGLCQLRILGEVLKFERVSLGIEELLFWEAVFFSAAL